MVKQVNRYSFDDILANLFSTDEDTIRDCIKVIKSNNNNDNLLNANEVETLKAFEKLYRDLGEIPTIEFFNECHPEHKLTSKSLTSNLHSAVRVFIKQRKNEIAANALTSLANEICVSGVTPEISDKVTNIIKSDIVKNQYENIVDKIVDVYESKVDNSGIKTGIAPVDEAIGGLKAGQVSVVAGFTGMGKSICSVSIMHSAIEQGYNVCYISLELTKEHLMYNLISRHSLDPKFAKKIEHRDLKSKTLIETDWNYTKEEIIPDLGNMPGNFYILDEQDIEAYDYLSFDNKLQEIENLCFKETGKGLDLIIVDHIQMLAFTNQDNKQMENTVINRWCNYFRSQCLDFLKSKRQVHVILVSQINRQGYLKAAKNHGMYDMTALKEANEIETCASVIIGVFSDTSLIASNQTMIGILKNRDGSRFGDAIQVPANYPYQLIGGVGFNENLELDDFSFNTFDFSLNGQGLGIKFENETIDFSIEEDQGDGDSV